MTGEILVGLLPDGIVNGNVRKSTLVYKRFIQSTA